jgi:hypothetical protein
MSIHGTNFLLFVARDLKIFFCKMFTMILLHGILEDFSKFQLFIVENCIFFWGGGGVFGSNSRTAVATGAVAQITGYSRNSRTVFKCYSFQFTSNKMYRLLVTLANTLSRIVTRFFESKCTHYIVARTFQNKCNFDE